MRLGRHIPIPRILHSASPRLPRPFIPHSLNPTTVPAYNRLCNSSLTSTSTSSAGADSNVITQQLPPNRSQSSPIHEYNKLVEAGKLRSDDYQTQIILKLQALHDALTLYDPHPSVDPPSLVRNSPFPFHHMPVLSYHDISLFVPLALAPFLSSHTKRCKSRQTKGIISLRRRWDRKDYAYGPLLQHAPHAHHPQATCAFSRVHA